MTTSWSLRHWNRYSYQIQMHIRCFSPTGGYRYTNRTIYQKLLNTGISQSMSRVAHCIDNGPLEGFWGIMKRERYYGARFTNREAIVTMIENYNAYRLQRNLLS